MASDRSKRSNRKSEKADGPSSPRADRPSDSGSANTLARPPVFALPPTRSSEPPRPSLAPPAPPPVQATAPTVSHELFDVEAAAVDHARDAIARRAAERASARPHPPRRDAKSQASSRTPAEAAELSDDPAQRLSTPLSWAAAKDPTSEAVPDDPLEPAEHSAPLALPPISLAEPLASAIPTGSVVVPPPKGPGRRWGVMSVVGLGAAGLVALGSVLGASQSESNAPSAASDALSQARPASNPIAANEAAETPKLELDLGVPESPPPEPTATVDPSSLPPVAPSGVLPALRPKIEKPPFDQQAASAALNQAAQAALSCRKQGDPAGSATVIVRYAPSGRVTSATVEAGPFAGTVTGGCIATTFRRALVPAFSGDYTTVKRTVTFR